MIWGDCGRRERRRQWRLGHGWAIQWECGKGYCEGQAGRTCGTLFRLSVARFSGAFAEGLGGFRNGFFPEWASGTVLPGATEERTD